MNHRLFVVVGMLGLGVVACETDTSSSPEPVPAPGPTPTPTPAPRPTCKPPTSGPTIHKGDVGENEVWTADASPHIVEYTVNVRNGATLTLEPCAEVQVAKGQSINVAYPITPNTGTLIAEGTADLPIRIVGKDGARWGSVSVRAPGTARLAHVSLEGGGGSDFESDATLAVYGDSEDGADEMVAIDHVRIAKSLGAGALLTRGAAFTAESRELTITESGSEENPYPLEIEEHAFDHLPTGAYKGNRVDEIFVTPMGGRTAGSGLLADATLHDRGVPYRIGKSEGTSLRIGGRTDEKLVTLTIEPGVVMKFAKNGSLRIQHFTNEKPSTAALRALGTADRPIVMTSASAQPLKGDWQGLWYGGIPGSTNQIDHVRIEYAGGDCGCILNTCSNIVEHEGAVIFTAPPSSAFITNTAFLQSAGHAITEGYDGVFVDFRATNTFEGVTGCDQTRPRDTNTSCPSPRPACY